MTGLMDLNFGEPIPQQKVPKSRTEEVQDFFNGEEEKRRQWEQS